MLAITVAALENAAGKQKYSVHCSLYGYIWLENGSFCLP